MISEFAERVNEAVERLCEGQDHTGQEVVIHMPVPKTIQVTCEDTIGIQLKNVEVTAVADGKISPDAGDVVFDAEKCGAQLYKVTGVVR